MIEEEDMLFRPVLRGMYPSTALEDGSIDLAHVLLCNEALDVEAENNRRAQAHERAQAESNKPRRRR